MRLHLWSLLILGRGPSNDYFWIALSWSRVRRREAPSQSNRSNSCGIVFPVLRRMIGEVNLSITVPECFPETLSCAHRNWGMAKPRTGRDTSEYWFHGWNRLEFAKWFLNTSLLDHTTELRATGDVGIGLVPDLEPNGRKRTRFGNQAIARSSPKVGGLLKVLVDAGANHKISPGSMP